MTLLQISNDLLFQIVEEIKKQQLDILKQLEEIQENEFIMNNIEFQEENKEEVLSGKNERERKSKLQELLNKNQDYNIRKETLKNQKYNIELSKINLKYLENKLLVYKILGSLMRND